MGKLNYGSSSNFCFSKFTSLLLRSTAAELHSNLTKGENYNIIKRKINLLGGGLKLIIQLFFFSKLRYAK